MIQHYLLKKSQNKTSQASQKPAKTKVSIQIYFHSPLHMNVLVAQLVECRLYSHIWGFWKIFFHYQRKGLGAP